MPRPTYQNPPSLLTCLFTANRVSPIVNTTDTHQEEALKGSAEHALRGWTRTPSAVMMSAAGLLLVLLSLLNCNTNGVSAEGTPWPNSTRNVADATASVDLSALHGRVDQRFLSVTIDASLAADEMFMYLLGLVFRSAVTDNSRVGGFMVSPSCF